MVNRYTWVSLPLRTSRDLCQSMTGRSCMTIQLTRLPADVLASRTFLRSLSKSMPLSLRKSLSRSTISESGSCLRISSTTRSLRNPRPSRRRPPIEFVPLSDTNPDTLSRGSLSDGQDAIIMPGTWSERVIQVALGRPSDVLEVFTV